MTGAVIAKIAATPARRVRRNELTIFMGIS
jgi:hypothetical protein